MPQVPPLVPLLLLAALLPAACCLRLSPSSDLGSSGRRHHQQERQFHWPRRARLAQPDGVVDERDSFGSDSDRSSSDEIDSSRLRHALEKLLELNDGELKALMMGMSPRKMASRIEPSTAFLLASSRRYLQRLNTILDTVDASSSSPSSSSSSSSSVRRSTWNPRIARRHKKAHQGRRDNPFEVAHSKSVEPISSEDPDSILGALSELSEYLSGADEERQLESPKQERKRRSHYPGHGHKQQSLHQSHNSRQYESHHYLYYLSTQDECPLSIDGIPKMFCPSPSATGEWHCVEDLELCDGHPQCPNEEDEAPTHCLFHNALKIHLDELTKYLVLSKLD